MAGHGQRFASPRERRLWILTALAVAGVYSTLALASLLADVLYNQGVVTAFYVGAMLLVGVTVLTQGLNIRPAGLEVGIALGIATVYSMVFLRLAIPERSHLIEYGVVAVCMLEALRERRRRGRRVPVPWLLAIVGTALVGVVDETIQLALPHRVFDPMDMLFNGLAAIMAVASMATLGWARRAARRALGRTDS